MGIMDLFKKLRSGGVPKNDVPQTPDPVPQAQNPGQPTQPAAGTPTTPPAQDNRPITAQPPDPLKPPANPVPQPVGGTSTAAPTATPEPMVTPSVSPTQTGTTQPINDFNSTPTTGSTSTTPPTSSLSS